MIRYLKTFFCGHPNEERVTIAGGCMDATNHYYCKKCGSLFIEEWDYNLNNIDDYSSYFEAYNINNIAKI